MDAVDVWDGPDGEPIITHGQTLTGTLFVRDVLTDVIKPRAFQASPYPLILSIENHLSVPQQDALAGLLDDILGGNSDNVKSRHRSVRKDAPFRHRTINDIA